MKSLPWRQILRKNFTRLNDLTDFLELDGSQRDSLVAGKFPLNVPFRLAQKMSKGTLDDPLVRQFLPFKEEGVESQGFVCDPVGDQLSRKSPKLLHKYDGRVLLVVTSACAMHCRFCFRQNFEYDVADRIFAEEFKIIKNDLTIHEVILSGGDPLSLSDEVLEYLLKEINAMPHINRIRFHTRFPIGIPERIDQRFLNVLAHFQRQIIFVLHINHFNELDDEVLASINLLQCAGCLTLNQSVLLKGVNDDAGVLVKLFEALADNGILPYYLHQLDRVKGTAHFEVAEEKGKELIAQISKKLPGYAIPRYVKEIAGQPHKNLIY